MGQAFDRAGNVLGDAEGATKREVFDKLSEAHPNAEEIRIKTQRIHDEFQKQADRPETPNVGDPMLQFFEFAHLPAHLQVASSKFWDVACHVVATLPRNPERTVALRKLLEAKDCAVRALLYKS